MVTNFGIKYNIKEEKKMFTTDNFKEKEQSFGFTGGICMAVLGKAEILPQYEIVTFELSVDIKTCLGGSAGIVTKSSGVKHIVGKTYWDPLAGSVTGKIKAGDYELLNINYSFFKFHRIDGPDFSIPLN